MECPKCHTKVADNQAVCPKCHKVLLLECPNCHELGETAVCEKCGYTILVKCSKCGKINHINSGKCRGCGLPVKSSLATQECDSDEFASVTVSFGDLNKIRKLLKSKDLYMKFYYKLKNMLLAHTKNVEGKVIKYDEDVVINFNKELSFATSSNKAVRFALKVINAFIPLNLNFIENFATPLSITITINKKSAENLQDRIKFENNVKSLALKKTDKKYLKGLQVVLDESVRDEVSKEFKTDSLYSLEEGGRTVMFYEILLDSYILPPSKSDDNALANAAPQSIKKSADDEEDKDLYSFKVFDINAKCRFEKTNAIELLDKLRTLNLSSDGKIVTIRSDGEYKADIGDIVKFYENNDYRVINVTCTREMNYKPWGFFTELLKDFYGITVKTDITKVDQSAVNMFRPLFEIMQSIPVKALTSEDARYNYMEKWSEFLSSLSNTVIIVNSFDFLDDTSIQTLELYFDKFKNIKPNFVFMTSKECSVHGKIKGLIRTNCYTEYTLLRTPIDLCLSVFKSDASNFVSSFYYEKIRENFKGSYLYFKNAINFLKDADIFVDFENKLLIKNSKSVVLPMGLKALYRARMKQLGADADLSFALAYAILLGPRISVRTLELLEVKDYAKHIKKLVECGFGRLVDEIFYFDDYNLLAEAASASVKKQAEEFLVKNILAKIGTHLDKSDKALFMGKLGAYKEEYLTLWDNSQFAIKAGDYDAYLKNCLGYLALVDNLGEGIEKSVIEENKMEVYNNILMFLYNYSPAKIYFIENVLLMDAIEEGDDEKIVKLSNLMLQGALISSNYTDALGLLHNILTRMKNPVLVVDGQINTKFLLLSLVNIEILYNIGDFGQCVEIAEDILTVLSPEVLDQAKPASFSTNLFVSHVMETLRLAGFAKLYTLDNDLPEFFEKVRSAMNAELPEQGCITAVKDFLAGKQYSAQNIEGDSPYSKVIFLILQELSTLQDDYKRFAQNIYQAKLLASDIHQREIELLCDLLIAYAYAKLDVKEKAEYIYKDVLRTSEKNAMFNILASSKYLLALLKIEKGDLNKGLKLINDALALIRKYDNQSQILYALCQKLYVDILRSQESDHDLIESEERKLEPLKESLSLIAG